MKTEPKDECRAAFEAWAKDQWEGRNIPDSAWLGWQAAWVARQETIYAMRSAWDAECPT